MTLNYQSTHILCKNNVYVSIIRKFNVRMYIISTQFAKYLLR